jgi:hypothetical protein
LIFDACHTFRSARARLPIYFEIHPAIIAMVPPPSAIIEKELLSHSNYLQHLKEEKVDSYHPHFIGF